FPATNFCTSATDVGLAGSDFLPAEQDTIIIVVEITEKMNKLAFFILSDFNWSIYPKKPFFRQQNIPHRGYFSPIQDAFPYLYPKKIQVMEAWKEYQEKNKERFLNEMLDLLRIPSISAKSEHKDDMLKCAEAVKQSLLAAGCDKAEVMPTEGHPAVYGE